MRRVSKPLAKLFAFSGVVLLLVVQPAFATPKRSSGGNSLESVVRSIIRHIRDLTDISFPPG
jgi:hypothetical protein